jgi:putative protease
MISPSSKSMIQKTISYTDSYLLGIKNFSVNLPFYLKEEELNEIVTLLKENQKEIFININKNMFSKDLEPLEKLLEKIETLQIDGICFYDISVISIMKRRGFKTPLVWNQEHFTTNYLTIQFWKEKGVDYTFLSNEITKEEIKEIKENVSSQLILQAFGYVPIFFSKRPLVTNYKNYFSLQDTSKIYYMKKDQFKYPLRELDGSFEAYHAKILNTLEIIKELEIDYVYLNSFLIEEDTFIKVLSDYKKNDFASIYQLYPKEMGFLDKKTVYRVRDL